MSEPTPVEDTTVATEGERPDIRVRLFGRTDVGQVREHNEDNFLVADLSRGSRSLLESDREQRVGARGTLLAVCDGMGGAAAGEIASQLAVDIIFERMTEGDTPKDHDELARRLVRAIEAAGGRIYQEARADRTRRGMGTTATVAAMLDDHLFLGQVGDSRGYVLRDGKFVQVTRDQSLVNQLIEAGQLTEEEAETFEHNNIILQALGTSDSVQVDLTYVELRRGDVLMLCSDGLSGMVRPDELREVLTEHPEPLEACKVLTERANQAGGHDNITCIVAHFDGQGLKALGDEGPDLKYRKYVLPEEPNVDRTGPTQRLFVSSSDAEDAGGLGVVIDHEDGEEHTGPSIPVTKVASLRPTPGRGAGARGEDSVHLPLDSAPPWLVGLFVAFALGLVAFMGFYLLR